MVIVITYRKIVSASLLCIAFLTFAVCSTAQDNKSGTIKVRKAKDPSPKIAGKTGGTITPAELCNDKGITCDLPGVKIIHFEITFYKGGEVTKEVEGNKIPSELCSIFLQQSKGSQVSFEKILAQDDQGRKFQLNPMRFTIDNSTAQKSSSRVNGMYKLQEEYVDLQRIYIRLFNDSLVYIVRSVDDPVVLNQYLSNKYRTEQKAHGKYYFVGQTIKIDILDQFWNFDYEGRYEPAGLILREKEKDGSFVEGELRFSVLPIIVK